MEFKEHELEWTDEKVNRFWNFYTKNPIYDNWWFTKIVGEAIVNISKKFIKKDANILDYGTGKGFLIEHLLNQKFNKVTACDFSDESVIHINKAFKNRQGFVNCEQIKGLPSHFESNHFDVVYLLEVIEHLSIEYYDNTLKELNRLLKKDGICIISTPNNENLTAEKVICADCGAIFHKVQHVRNFTVDSLTKEMEKYGFTSLLCKAINIDDYLKKNRLKKLIKSLHYFFKKKDFEERNLLYIGKKSISVE